MAYTEEQTIAFIENIDVKDFDTLYTQSFIKNHGIAKGSNKSYPEILADWMLSHDIKSKLDAAINVIKREQLYKMNHPEEYSDEPDNNHIEDWIARKMFTEKHYKIGEMLDYQVPLKDKQDTRGGKIDLIAKNKDEVYLLELKRDDNQESLLRAVLEIYTYSRQLFEENFRKSYNLPTQKIVPAVLVFENSLQYNEYRLPQNERLRELMDLLGVKFFVVKKAKFLISDDVKPEE